jgi:hypothetical protein
MLEWMSTILVGEMAGADSDFGFGLEVVQMLLILVQVLKPLIQLGMFHMDQMILSKPSVIIIICYLDISGHDRKDEQDIDWRNGWC